MARKEEDLETKRIIKYSMPIVLNVGLYVDMIMAIIIDSDALLSIGIIGFGTLTFPLCHLINKKYELGARWVMYTVISVFISILILSSVYYLLLIR